MPLSPPGALLRRHDPDRFLTALFAPEAAREILFALYSFNHELARAREVVSEPMLALIRLQWWREVVSGERRRHEVAGPLGEALDAGRLDPGDLLGMIDGREIEAEAGIDTVIEFRGYLLATSGGLAAAAGRVLGADADMRERLRALGAAYGAVGAIRNVAMLARQRRCVLPADLLQAHGLNVHAVMAAPNGAALRPVLDEVAGMARAWLREGGGFIERSVIPAGLVAVLARRDLRHIDRPAAPRGFGDQLAVLRAALARRV